MLTHHNKKLLSTLHKQIAANQSTLNLYINYSLKTNNSKLILTDQMRSLTMYIPQESEALHHSGYKRMHLP